MVHLTRIYTRTGDAGKTRLSDNSVTRKTDPRVEAYGSVDELNSAIGVLLANYDVDEHARAALRIVQNELFDLGADLSNPFDPDPKWEPLRIIQPSIDRLEGWCDEFIEGLPSLNSFILPGGSATSAQFHLLRTMTRRAERQAWAAAEVYGLLGVNETNPEATPGQQMSEPVGGQAPEAAGDDDQTGRISPLPLKYLNRLSDLFFILARHANARAGVDDVLWVPGGERNPNQ